MDSYKIASYHVRSAKEGFLKARTLLQQELNSTVLLLLSGGRTPKEFYTMLAEEKKNEPGAVALVDERYGTPMHADSNEKMITDTGFLAYCTLRDIPIYSILQRNLSIQETAESYNQKVTSLLRQFQSSVAIMGIGLDGHTAGIPSQVERPMAFEYYTSQLISFFKDSKSVQEGGYGERITLTFAGLSYIQKFIVLVFGDDKKNALELIFRHGSEEEVPARFFKRPNIAKKTLFITDQRVYYYE